MVGYDHLQHVSLCVFVTSCIEISRYMAEFPVLHGAEFSILEASSSSPNIRRNYTLTVDDIRETVCT